MPRRKKTPGRRRKPGGKAGLLPAILVVAAGLALWAWFHAHQSQVHHRPRARPAAAVSQPSGPAPAAHSPPLPPLPLPELPPPPANPPPASRPTAVPGPVPGQMSGPGPSPAPPDAGFPRAPRNPLELQIALARHAISPGSIDGAMGGQTRAALAAFARASQSEAVATGANPAPGLVLLTPPLTTCVITSNDLASLQPLGKTWLDKSCQSSLAYESELELIAETAHAHPALIKKLNPGMDWSHPVPGAVVTIPDDAYPPPAGKAACVVIHLSQRYLEAFDADTNLIAHFPCSIAAKVEKRPVGELHVIVIAPHPNYTVDPALFPESAELQALGHKLILPPGPNNPVGVAWIGLDRPGYGMHGTPSPEQVGRTESHGCFRLANWDAAYLVKLVWVGMPVQVQP